MQPPPILLDLSAVPVHCCNHGLDALHKSIAEDPPEDRLWRPHDNPFLADLCDDWSADGTARLQAVQDALLGALGVEAGGPILRKADAWSSGKIAAVKLRLQKPLADYAPSDWLALVDLIIQTRLSPRDLEAQAAWLAYRAQLAGRLDALRARFPGLAPQEVLLNLANQTGHLVKPPLTRLQAQAQAWAKAAIGVNLTALSDGLRAALSRLLLGHIQSHGLAARGILEQSLRDTFGALNRDWRRVAITEAGEVANRAYLGEMPDGARIQRLEAYEGACPFCAKINGQVFTWSTQPLSEEHGWTHVWPGKTNVGRSMSPRKRTADGLVERLPSELWWPTEGVIHSNCRGRWLVLPDDRPGPGVDPAFADWLRQEIQTATGRS